MNRKDIVWLYLYMVAGIIDLSLITQNLLAYRYVTKPIILVALIVYFFKGSKLISGSLLRKSVLAALGFSLGGDLLLIFPHLFLYGLGAFLMALICYVFAFKLTQRLSVDLSRVYFIQLFLYNLPIYFFAALLYYLIHRQLGAVKVPVIIYIGLLVILVTTARERYKKTNAASFWQVLIGGALFFVSHGILLADLFFEPILDAEVLIMGSYLLAQLLIVMGLRSHFLDILYQKISK